MFEEFLRLSDAKRWAKATNRNPQSMIEVDYYDSIKKGWRATLWTEGLPEKDLLIHERQPNRRILSGKNVTFSDAFKSVQHENFQEIWVNCLKILC